jgi:hypothetical protein
MDWQDPESSDSVPSIVGQQAVDEAGAKIGTVTDVIYDVQSGEASWAVVGLGLLGAEHYVPLADTYQSDSNRLVLPFDKRTIKQSPKANKDHVLTSDVEADVRRYYGLAA